MKNHPFLRALAERVLLADAAVGTELMDRGVPRGANLDLLTIEHPDLVRRVHEDYIRAGADVITTNTFTANAAELGHWGLQDRVRQINLQAAKLARDVREISGQPVFVAGSVGPIGRNLRPLGDIPLEQARTIFRSQIDALLEGGVDLIVLETFPSLAELAEAIRAAQEACDLPIVAQATFTEDATTMSGESPAEFARAAVDLGADVVGINCGTGPQFALDFLAGIGGEARVPLSCSPNAGLPRLEGRRAVYGATPEYFADYVPRFVAVGARLIGGCCGTSPQHIAAMKGALAGAAEREAVVVAAPAEQPQQDYDEPIRTGATLREKLAAGKFVVSVEIDPPRGSNPRKAIEGARLLKDAGADAINVGDSPMARVRMSAIAMTVLIQQQAGIEGIIHCTTRDRNLMALQADLLGAHALGVRNVIALTGDPPSVGPYSQATGVWDTDSIGFIRILKTLNEGVDWAGNSIGTPTDFFVAAAANPAHEDLELEIERCRRKLEAGADVIMTQFVWDVKQLTSFFERVGPVHVPILAGVLPLQSSRHAEFMHNEVPGVFIPDDLRERMRKAGENGIREGLAIAKDFLSEIREFVQGIYVVPSFGRYEVVGQFVSEAAKG